MTQQQSTPRHVAIIMDGNGRWAKQRLLPRLAGHKAGIDTTRQIVEIAAKHHIEFLSLFTFSSENWKRPPEEVENILSLFLHALQYDAKSLHKNNVKLRIVGNTAAFSSKLQQSIADAESLTAQNTGLTLIVAANYGGQWDIFNAAQQLAKDVIDSKIMLDAITPAIFEQRLALSDIPHPDLFIRTGGEQRISNFFLWQLAYTELYFTDVYWPDFDENEFVKAINHFANRQRRFGLTGEQVEKLDRA
ncbi:MAG: polyprenyl diphosphate synthase [Gammaproteobacteria bacterium]